MPRDSSGNYTLPLGNPVVDGTVIDVNWANPTMSDIAVQLNNVLTRDGLLAPTSPFFVVDGTAALPGLAFISQNGSGLWRDSTQVGLSVGGVAKQVWSSAGSQINGSLNVTSDFNTSGSVGGTPDLILKSSGTEKMRIDAAGNVGIGTNAPDANARLHIYKSGSPAVIIAQNDTTSQAYFRSKTTLGDWGAGTGIGVAANAWMVYDILASAERMRIDAAGNVMIGNTVPSIPAAGRTNLVLNGATSSLMEFMTGTVRQGYVAGVAAGNLEIAGTNFIDFVTGAAPAERMRIASDGRVAINTTSALCGGQSMVVNINAADFALGLNTNDGGTTQPLRIAYQGAAVGSITATAAGVVYNTTSDYRLKENITDLDGSGDFIDALRPRRFSWKGCDVRSAGFIAHEFAEVSPGSVSGTQDGAQMQMLDASTPEMMANIVSELKSLRLRIAALGG